MQTKAVSVVKGKPRKGCLASRKQTPVGRRLATGGDRTRTRMRVRLDSLLSLRFVSLSSHVPNASVASSSSSSSSSSLRNVSVRSAAGDPSLGSSLSEAFETGVRGKEQTIPVPLDYFKILGLGSQRHASKEELERAYAARVSMYSDSSSGAGRSISDQSTTTLASPFTESAVAARERVLELAREALTSRSPGRQRLRVSSQTGGVALRPTHENVAIPLSWVPGVLLLAVECGDFDYCVGIGTSMLEQSKFSLSDWFSSRDELSSSGSPKLKLNRREKRDISLAVGLSHCELAKVYLDGKASTSQTRGEKRRVAEGCAHLNSALKTLRRAPGKDLMPMLCDEIEMTLERLVAPCALDHLRLPLDAPHAETRKRAALVLEELLLEPSDTSSGGANIDRSFVFAVLKSLTAREFMTFLPWKETEEKLQHLPWFDSSMLYNAGVACLVSAYKEKNPKLVERALDLFEILEEGLEKDNNSEVVGLDLASERAVSMVLLGNLDEALAILEQSEEQGGGSIRELEKMEASGGFKSGAFEGLPENSAMMMTFIRFNSGKDSDGGRNLLNGIITFTEKWLERKSVFRCGLNLNLNVSEYFDEKVRAYLSGSWLASLTQSDFVESVGSAAAKLGGLGERATGAVREMNTKTVLLAGFSLLCLSASVKCCLNKPLASTTTRATTTRATTTSRSASPSVTTQQQRREVTAILNKWQQHKQQALGKDHDVSQLSTSLASGEEMRWRERASRTKANGCYWEYSDQRVKVENVENVGGGALKVQATVSERGRLLNKEGRTLSEYSEPYQVTYEIKQRKIQNIKL